jgi:P27 family predicted phage terminase small subunit
VAENAKFAAETRENAMKGRKPTPKPILQLRGSRVRGPHVAGIVATPGVPPAPDWLCEIGRGEWERITPMLEASRVMSPRHQQTLAAYCDAFADMVTADRELKENGATIVDAKGKVSNHPAWSRKRDARVHMLKLATEFGLTASALARVSVVEQKSAEDDEDRKMFG